MAEPTEAIKIIATDSLGSDGYTNKEEPTGLINTEGYGKQSLPYQQLNYLCNNFGSWLAYINTEQIPDETLARETADATEATTRETGDTALQDQIDTITTTTIPEHTTATNPHSNSQAISDWTVKSGTLANGATVPIPTGYSLSDCHIIVSQPESYTGTWDLDEDLTVTHYRAVCRVVSGVVESYVSVYKDEGVGDSVYSVNANYLLVGRKGAF